MKTHLALKARHESLKGETMLMEANHEHSSIFVPRTIQWKDILSNNDWHFENITPPFASHSERSQIERVIQFPDGSIELKFLDNPARRSSSNRRSSWSPSTSGPSRPVPRPPSSSKTLEEADDEIISVADNIKGKVTGVDFSGDIPKIFYQDIPGSPTASEMEPPKEKPSWLGMLKVNKPFEPDLNILQEQWIHPDNQVKRKWYVSSYPLKQRESFRDLWMTDMRRIGCEIEFFKWFEMTGRIENCTESLQVIINKWFTTSNKVVESITPPLEGINIPIAGTVIKASPFKEKSDKTGGILTSADIDRVVEQNNYSNQILPIISRQIEDTKPSISGRPIPVSTSSSHNIETYPGFRIPEFSKEKFPKLSDTFEVTGNIIEKINAQLNNFNISVKDDNTSKKVSTLHVEPNPKTQEKSNLLQKLASSRFHNMKNYHNKPSFPDLQYEENAFLSTSSHEGRSITEWNTDGLVEHQVYNKLHEMGVAITAYKMCGSADRDVANMDFGFITPPDKIKKDKREKSHRKKSRRRDDSTRPKKKKFRSKKPNDAKVDVCWTCGKTGHKANECRSKTKKKKINLLNIDEETKGKLLAILDEPFSEYSGTSDEYSDDEDIDLDYDSDVSQSGKDCTCTEAFCTCDSTPHIRVLSDHSKEALFDVIQHINDNEARNRFLLELKNLLLNTDKPKTRPIIEPFSMKQIMNRSDNHSEPSISDLRHEVCNLKEEIRNIKARLCIVETD
uniref:CCHC-type domain-containing protein n=1 Tax=Solanum tuberosum TaxID=4113 RepID=M1B5X5_SOLTU